MGAPDVEHARGGAEEVEVRQDADLVRVHRATLAQMPDEAARVVDALHGGQVGDGRVLHAAVDERAAEATGHACEARGIEHALLAGIVRADLEAVCHARHVRVVHVGAEGIERGDVASLQQLEQQARGLVAVGIAVAARHGGHALDVRLAEESARVLAALHAAQADDLQCVGNGVRCALVPVLRARDHGLHRSREAARRAGVLGGVAFLIGAVDCETPGCGVLLGLGRAIPRRHGGDTRTAHGGDRGVQHLREVVRRGDDAVQDLLQQTRRRIRVHVRHARGRHEARVAAHAVSARDLAQVGDVVARSGVAAMRGADGPAVGILVGIGERGIAPQLRARGVAHVAAGKAGLVLEIGSRSLDGHTRAEALHAGALHHRNEHLGHVEQLAEVEVQSEHLHAAQLHGTARLHAAGKSTRRAHGAHVLGVEGPAVGDGATAHEAHVAAGHTAVHGVRLVLVCSAPSNHISTIDVISEEGRELILGGERLAVEIAAIVALRGNVLRPAIPRLEADAAHGARDLRVLLGGIGHLQSAQDIVGLHQAEEQADAPRLGSVARLHIARETTGHLGAVDAADALGHGVAPGAGVVVAAVLLGLPRRGARPRRVAGAPDVTAEVMPHVAACHAALHALGAGGLRAHGAAAGDGRGLGVANRGHEVLHERREGAVGAHQAVQQLGQCGLVVLTGVQLAQHARHVARLDLPGIAARRNLADHVGEVVGV